MRKTKIICTLGPAVDHEDAIRALMLGGMNAARFNFSHGTHESHLAQLNKLKQVRDELGLPVATILDTKGPEMRIKTFANGPVTLKRGDEFILTTEDVPGDSQRVSVTYDNLHAELTPGCHILIDDGLIELIVRAIEGREIFCAVENGGILGSSKSINIPNVAIQLPSLTPKDEDDLRFAAEQGFDFIAASFVRTASDVENIRQVLHRYGGENIGIIAKIENRQGVDNLAAIIAVSDGVMVARGDLGVEIPAYEVPIIQKKMIAAVVPEGKPVIIATQMLDSMMRNPRATRAEVSDVANAVFDGASCVMLSGETASGKYPLEALAAMVQIITAAEDETNFWGRFRKAVHATTGSINDAISHSCCLTAMDLNARTILTATTTGRTARMISRHRPACAVMALTTNEVSCRKLAISWGIDPFLCDMVESTDELLALCVDCALRENMAEVGDTVVITAGIPIGNTGFTNLIKAQKVEQPR